MRTTMRPLSEAQRGAEPERQDDRHLRGQPQPVAEDVHRPARETHDGAHRQVELAADHEQRDADRHDAELGSQAGGRDEGRRAQEEGRRQAEEDEGDHDPREGGELRTDDGTAQPDAPGTGGRPALRGGG